MSEDRKVVIPVVVDGTGAKAGFEDVKQGGRDMAQALQQSAQQAGQALETGMVASVRKTTEAMAQAKVSWTDFLKSNMGPAMKEFSAQGMAHADAHTAAIRKIAEQWKEYKATGQSALAAVASQSSGAAAATDKLTFSQQRLLDSLSKQATIAGQGKAAWLEIRAAQLGVSEQAATYIGRLRQAEQAQAATAMSAKQLQFALRGVPAQMTDIVTSLAAGQRPFQVLLQQGGQLKDMFGGIGPAARALGGYVAGLVNPFTIGAAAIAAIAFAANEGSKELRAFQAAATMNGNAIGVSVSRFSELRDSIAGIAGTKGKAAEALTAIAESGLRAGDNVRGIAEAAILMEKATGQAISKTVEQFKELHRSPADAAAKLNEQYNFLTAATYKQIKALEDQGRATDAARLAEQTYADALKTRAQSVVDSAGIIEKAWRGVSGAAKGAWDAMLGVGRDLSLGEQLAQVQAKIAKAQGPFDASAFGGNAEARAQLPELREQAKALQRKLEIESGYGFVLAENNRLQALGIQFSKDGEQFASKRAQREKELTKARVEGQELVARGIITEKELTQRLAAIREKFKDTAGPKIGRDAFQSEALREYSSALDAFQKIAGSASAKADDLSKTQEKLHELQASPVWATYSHQQQEQLIYAAALAQAEEDRAAATALGARAVKDATQAIIEGENARSQQVRSAEQAAAAAEREYEQYGLLKSQVQQLTLAKLQEARASAALAGEDVADIERRIAAQKRLIDATQGIERKDAQKKVNDDILQEWQRTTDSINQSLTDALLRGFESGKDFGRNLRDTLKNMFSTMVLKPVIQAVMAPVSGQLASFGQSIMGGGQPPGFMGPPSPFGQSGFSIGGFSGSQLGFLGTIAAGGSMVGSTIGSLFGFKGDQMTVASVGGALLGGIPGAILGSLVAPGGGPKTESGFGLGVPTRGDPAASRAIVEAVQAQYKAIAGQLAKDLKVGVFTAQDPAGDAMTQVGFEAALNGRSIESRAGRLGGIENVGRSPAELQQELTDESNRVILKALADTGLPDKIGAYLRQLGDVDKLSGGALTDAVAKLQKAMTERQTLEQQYFDLTHTELERLTATRDKERAAIDDTNRALYDTVATLTDLRAAEAKARDALMTAYERESDALKGVIERNQGFAESLRAVRDGLSLSGGALTPSQRTAQLGAAFQSALTQAVGGNEKALQGLGDAGKSFVDALRDTARNRVELVSGIARVQAGLTTAASAADGRATVAQQQLDAMTQQLSALGLINTSVLSVGQALGSFLSAQTAIAQEQLRYAAQLAAAQSAPEQVVAVVAAAAAAVAAVSSPVESADAAWLKFQQSIETGGAFVGGAATGGFRPAGPLMVGELGPEIVDFQTPGRVYTADQTRGMFSTNAELLPAVRELLRAIVATDDNRKREAIAMLQQLSTMAAKLRKFDIDGLPPERVTA